MVVSKNLENLAAKFDLLFGGRRDVYGVLRADGSVECVRRPRTLRTIAAHLTGEQSIAVYPVCDDNTCAWACADLDCRDAPENARGVAEALQTVLAEANVQAWIEKSKSKGYHVWVFFDGPVPASLARALIYATLNVANIPRGIGKAVSIEIFPKQEKLAEGQIGNCLNIPYFAPDVTEGKRIVLGGNPGHPLTAEEFADAALESRVNEGIVKAAVGNFIEKTEKPAKPGETKPLPAENIERLVKLLAPYWKAPGRHYLALGVAGAMAKKGFTQQAAEALIRKVAKESGDEELNDRLAAVHDTYRKVAEGQDVAGASYLVNLLPFNAARGFLSALADAARYDETGEDEGVRVVDDAGAPAFLAKPPVEGLLRELCDYFGLSTDANLEIRMSAALCLMSLLVGRRAWLQEGKRRIYPNLWVFVVGPSSDTRKSTLQTLCRDLWEEVVTDEAVAAHMFPEREDWETIDTGIKDDEKPAGRAAVKETIWDDDFSPEALAHKLALITAVCRYTVGMIFTDEAALHLEALQKKDYLSGTLGQMLKLYDCPRRAGFERRQAGRRTPYRIENVFLNWFLVTTPQTLTAAATNQIKYSGFFQRCCLVPAGPRERDPEDFQPPVPDEVTRALVEKLKRLALIGPVEVQWSEEAREVYLAFARELREFRRKNSNLLEAELLARLDTTTKKLAVILELAKRAEEGEHFCGEDFFFGTGDAQTGVLISEKAAKQAVGLARYFWKATVFVAENWLSPSEFMAERRLVMDVLQREGGGCTKSVLLRKTKLTVKKLNEILDTLEARKEIVRVTNKTKGRPQDLIRCK